MHAELHEHLPDERPRPMLQLPSFLPSWIWVYSWTQRPLQRLHWKQRLCADWLQRLARLHLSGIRLFTCSCAVRKPSRSSSYGHLTPQTCISRLLLSSRTLPDTEPGFESAVHQIFLALTTHTFAC